MRKDSQNSISKNRQLNQTSNNNKSSGEDNVDQWSREHAVSKEDTAITEVNKTSNKNSYADIISRNLKHKSLKPVLLATLSAIIIGSLLGFFLLNLFVDVNEDLGHKNGDNMPVAGVNNDDKSKGQDKQQNQISDNDLKSLQAFVLQAGKFEAEKNADNMADAFQSKNHPATVWKKDEFYYVLTGIADSKKVIKQLENELDGDKPDVYVKKWQTKPINVKLSNAEEKWMTLFQKQWQKSLASVSNSSSLSKEPWLDVIDNMPDTDKLSEFRSFLKKQQSQMGQQTKWRDQHTLLQIWMYYHDNFYKDS